MILIGTSGYVFNDWVGPFYPKGLPRSDYLAFYARQFSAVEVNATYYRIPAPRVFENMARRTPENFRFVVKAHGDMTHRRSRETALYGSFREAVRPLVEARKLDGILLQFPFGVRNNETARAHLAFLRRSLPGTAVWAEFRHESWNRDAVFDFLRELDIGFCAVDEPALPGLMPPVCRETTDLGYVRFHGRNADTWWGGGHERYDWEYTSEELGDWLDGIRESARRTSDTFVFFNNCTMGRAVKSARTLKQLLGLPGGPDLELGF